MPVCLCFVVVSAIAFERSNVGGSNAEVKQGNAHKVKIPHSSAMLEALLTDAIKWTEDPDFGYLVVDVDDPANAELIEKVPVEILRPRLFFERQRRGNEYDAWVAKMKSERRAFLEGYDVDPAIIAAVVN